MPGDPKECREHAKRCWELASEATNPVLKESLIDLAQRWARLASDLEVTKRMLDAWGELSPSGAKTGCVASLYHAESARGLAERLKATLKPSQN
jgi:hypothetical protein